MSSITETFPENQLPKRLDKIWPAFLTERIGNISTVPTNSPQLQLSAASSGGCWSREVEMFVQFVLLKDLATILRNWSAQDQDVCGKDR
jgi:hypothetical protein